MSEPRFRNDITVSLVQHVGNDSSIVAAAKVSVDGSASVAALDREANAGLLRYLMKQKHGTPFEHASLTFLVEAPIFVFREWHRHRIGWSYNETSARYREMEPVFWVPPADRKLVPAPDYKAARPVFVPGTPDQLESVLVEIEGACHRSWLMYQAMLQDGIAKEVARCVLPVGTYSSMYATCNPRSLMAFLSLRTHDPEAKHVSYPQAEIEQAARAMEVKFGELFPVTYAAFCEFGRVAP